MPLLPTSMKPRSFLSILLVIGLITTLYFYKRTSSSLYEPLVNYEAVAHKPEGFSNQDALRLKIEQYLQSHLTDLQAPFNSTEDEALLGLKLQGKPIHLDAYRAELLDNYHKYLSPASPSSPPHLFLSLVLSRLSLTPPSSHLPLRPETITTTDAHRSLVPWEFSRWKEICPDWEVRVFEDDDMYDWMERVFGGSMGRKVWEELPRVVLKTDIFRYFMLLVEGGIYSDSDTAPIIHPDQWGLPYTDRTDPLVLHLTRILGLAHSDARHSGSVDDESEEFELDGRDEEEVSDVTEGSNHHLDTSGEMWKRSGDSDFAAKSDSAEPRSGDYIGPGMIPHIEDGSELGPPSLVVSVESDAIEFGWHNWREVGLSRADQIVQWTIMARPGHPVFLDAIGQSIKKSLSIAHEASLAAQTGEIYVPESALEWTGPGVFTDSVMRYLLVRYGFNPRQLLHVKDPIRVGDVLILPAGSYSSVSPFTGEDQRKWAASFHGFFGRWRDADPKIQEQERLKKIKEEEEEAAEKVKQEQEDDGRITLEEIDLSDTGVIGD